MRIFFQENTIENVDYLVQALMDLYIWWSTNMCPFLCNIFILVELKTVDKVWCASYISGLVQERRNSIAKALELRLSWTNSSDYDLIKAELVA